MGQTTTGGWVNGTALAGWLLESPDGGAADSGTTKLYMGRYCSGVGSTSSCYDPDDGIVYMASCSVDNKFVIAHEIGHQCQWDRAGNLGSLSYTEYVPTDDWMCRCDHVTSSNQLHCLQSREKIDTAIIEGFGYFFAAKLFNDEDENDCWMAHSKELLVPHWLYPEDPDMATLYHPPVQTDCRAQKQWQETWCDDSNTGVEWDWMNFFWEWHSGGGTSAYAATMDDIYDILHYADNWDGDSSDSMYWSDVDEGAKHEFGSSSNKYLYFDGLGDDYGVHQ